MRVGVADFKPSRLTQARESMQMTKAALANLLRITDATVSKWESGKQLPEEKLLSELSEKLGYPSHWFTKSLPNDLASKTYFFRSNVSTTKSARARAKDKLLRASEITSMLIRWVDLPEIKLPKMEEQNFLMLDDNEIQQAAIECRKLWGLSDLPVPDVILAMESAGIIVVRDHLNEIRMDGVSCWIGERPYAFIASDKANGIRNRFDASHELCHLICHQNISEDDYKKHYKEIERQANLFASCFLLPATSFAADITFPTLDGLLSLKPRWKTSVAAMIHRCHDLDLIDDAKKLSLYKGKSARGWSKEEPKDREFIPERPRLLHRCIKMLVDNNIITKQALLTEMALPAHSADAICSLDNYFSDLNSDEDNLFTLKLNSKPSAKSSEKASVHSLSDRRAKKEKG